MLPTSFAQATPGRSGCPIYDAPGNSGSWAPTYAAHAKIKEMEAKALEIYESLNEEQRRIVRGAGLTVITGPLGRRRLAEYVAQRS